MRRPILTALAVPFVAVLLAPPATGAAPTKRLADRAGVVKATVTWRKREFTAANVRLEIVRAGQPLVRGPVLDESSGDPTSDTPVGVTVVDLDGDAEPEVVVDLFSNGAHCCTYSRIYRLAGTAYSVALHGWGNYGYALEDLNGDGLPELRSNDDRFAYAFTSYAGSVPAIQIWRYGAGVLTDVTREFPDVVRRDAVELWALYRKERKQPGNDVRGILAAYQAEKYLLGEQDDGWARLRAARAAGDLRGFGPWPSGWRYLRAIRTFLVEAGYGLS
jgi:hypothetical protein